jgi:transcriptional repressor NrdR
MPAVIKKDGRREPFDRSKMIEGMQKACEKRSIATQKIEEIVTRIEKRIQSFGLKEVPTRTIGQMMMVELHALDKVAYVRFASVYREFRDVEEFVAELTELDATIVPGDDKSSLQFSFDESPQKEGPTK